MSMKTEPFLSGKWGWELGESGWKTGADENFLKFAYMLNSNVNGFVSSLPGSPTNGTAYVLTTDYTLNARVDGAWYKYPIPKGFVVTDYSTGDKYEFNGSSFVSTFNSNDKAKLNGIAVGATANASDAALRDRSTHTGTQATSTITGLDAALAAKAPSDNPTFTGTVTVTTPLTSDNSTKAASTAWVKAQNYLTSSSSGIVTSVASRSGDVVLTSADVGLANVNNTSDLSKPVSTATQTALDLKAPLASPTFTGTVVLPSTTSIGTTTATELSYVHGVTSAIQSQLNSLSSSIAGKADLASPTFTGTVSGITKAMVGLSNVDNTTDLNKPVSTATQTALNAKQDLNSKLTSISGLSNVSTGLIKLTNGVASLDTTSYLTSINSSQVTTALGYTPANKAGDTFTGNISISSSTASTSTSTGALTVSGGVGVAGDIYLGGGLNFTGTAKRILGDFSNTTIANRVLVQTTAVNSPTSFGLIPNGTITSGAAACQVNLEDSSSIASGNGSYGQFINLQNTEISIRSNIRGTGTYLPITFHTSGSSRMQISAAGDVSISNTTASTNRLTGALVVAGGVGVSGNVNIGGAIQLTTAGASVGLARASDGAVAGYVGSRSGSDFSLYNMGGSSAELIVSTTADAKVIARTSNVDRLTVSDTNVSISQTTNSASPSSGALIVTGGAGIGNDLYVGGVSYSSNGFATTLFSSGSRNPIWRFGNAPNYGLSYFQGTSGINSEDTVGVHFGTATAAASPFYVTPTKVGITSGTASTSTTTGALVVNGGVGISGSANIATSIELGAVGVSNNPFIDFHSGAIGTDYDVRLISFGGNGTTGQGTLVIGANTVSTAAGVNVTNTAQSFSYNSGALTVTGGVGIGGRLNTSAMILSRFDAGATPTYSSGQLQLSNAGSGNPVALGFHREGSTAIALVHDSSGALRINNTSYGSSTGTSLTVGSAFLVDSTASTSTSTGALTVVGGVGVGGAVYAGSFNGPLNGTASAANNIVTGSAGQLLYQAGSSNTQFVATGSAGQILQSNGTSAPSWTSGPTLSGITTVSNSTNSSSTSTGALVITGGAGVGGNVYIGGTLNVAGLISGTATTAYNIIGGTAGQLLYQGAVGSTQYVSVGAAGQLLQSNGTSAPSWVSHSAYLVDSYGSTSTSLAPTANALNAVYNLLGNYIAKATPSQKFQNLGSIGSTANINVASGCHVLATATTACTWTFTTSLASDEAISITLELTNGGIGTQTWPTGIRWAGGTAPTLTASGTDILVFTKAGTANWRGYLSSKDNR